MGSGADMAERAQAERVQAERAGPGGAVLVLTILAGPAAVPGVASGVASAAVPLSAPVRAALLAALAADPGAAAVVIRAAGADFAPPALPEDAADPGPADIPSLATLCRAVEDQPRPVVVALQGRVFGPGAELALAAHRRVAATGAQIAFPGVAYGLPPAAGASQRLPRLVGGAEALALLLRGLPSTAEEGLATGLIDQVTEGDPLPAALAAALEMSGPGPEGALSGPRPVGAQAGALADAAGFAAAVAQARTAAAQRAAPALAAIAGRIIDCVEAALYLPYPAGLALEAAAHEDMAASGESRGLIAAARAQRQAARLPPALAALRPPPLAQLGLAGTGPQMVALAAAALAQGLQVGWHDADPGRLAAGVAALQARLLAEQRAGRLTELQRGADLARLVAVSDLAALGEPPILLHAGRGADYAVISRRRPGALHLVLNGAEGALGVAVAPSGRLSELALPEGMAPAAVVRAVQLMRRLRLPPVLVGRMPVLGRRVVAAGQAALAALLAQGVPAAAVSAALTGFGQPPPDLAPAAATVPPHPMPARPMPAPQILGRWLGAMANEGARLLAAEVARRPSDIDHVLVQGHGFPRWQGGPMHLADRRGLMVLRADLRRWSREAPPGDTFWTPQPLIDGLVADSLRFADLDF